jgi:hypothetical protein
MTPKINRRDWRNLPFDQWNTLTVHAYFADMNRDKFGVETYLPLRNWSFEQAQIKRALTAYGAETLKAAFDECFRDYRPTREYPILTAGFAISYRINGIIPRLQAERAAAERRKEAEGERMTAEELAEWL